ncbi:MAG: B12-binding domain-containing radical SAM protein [bacterium]
MRVALLDPATRFATIEPYENLGLAYLTAALRQQGHEVLLLSTAHQNLSMRQTIRAVTQFNPALLGITVLGANAKRAINVVHRLRESGYNGHITLGGYYPTFHATELMHGFPALDSIVRNEGEMTLLDLVEHLPDNDLSEVLGITYRDGAAVKENPQRPFTKTIDELPFPARDFTPHILQMGSFIHVSTSRGCYANCSFCSIAKFFRMGNGKVWRRRSAESLADEVEMLVKRFACNRFKFIDDQFILTNKEGHEFADAFEEELGRRNLQIKFSIACRANNIEKHLVQRLKAIGLEKVFVGVESGHQRGLDTFDKETTVEMNNQALATLREFNLNYDLGFILIDPYTTYDELKQNLLYLLEQKSLIKQRGTYLSVTTSLMAYGGTPIYDRLVKERRLLGDYFNGFYYQIADKEVRRFQFLMEKVVDGLLAKAINQLLFWWKDLRSYLRDVFKSKVLLPKNSTKGGERYERVAVDVASLPHAAVLEPREYHTYDHGLIR